MQIEINGQMEEIAPCTIAALVRQKGLKPEALVVEHNLNIVKQDQWSRIELQAGDTLELLSFVGGG
jgi:thiamine biosynthesis protein ThiS